MNESMNNWISSVRRCHQYSSDWAPATEQMFGIATCVITQRFPIICQRLLFPKENSVDSFPSDWLFAIFLNKWIFCFVANLFRFFECRATLPSFFRFQSLVQCVDILAEFLSNSGTEQIDWSKVSPFDTDRLHSWVMCRLGLMCICTQTAATWDDDGKKWSWTLLGWRCCRACAPQCNFPWLLLRVKRMKYSKMPLTFHHTALVAGKHSTFALLFCVRLLIYHHSFGIPFAQAIALQEECHEASVNVPSEFWTTASFCSSTQTRPHFDIHYQSIKHKWLLFGCSKALFLRFDCLCCFALLMPLMLMVLTLPMYNCNFVEPPAPPGAVWGVSESHTCVPR